MKKKILILAGGYSKEREISLDTAKSVLEQDLEDLVKRTDLEEETIIEVRKILSEEFDDNS